MIENAVVSGTDYALAAEATVLAWLLGRQGRSRFETGIVAAFAGIAAAALLGGTLHGLLEAPDAPGRTAVWAGVLLAIGFSAFGLCLAAAALLDNSSMARAVRLIAATGFAVYCNLILFAWQDFRVAVFAYVPASALLLLALGYRWRRSGEPAALTAVGGILLSFVASALQQARVALHQVWIDHNALYHLLMAVALWGLFHGAAGLVQRQPTTQEAVR